MTARYFVNWSIAISMIIQNISIMIVFIDDLFPVKEDLSDQQKKNVDRMKEDVKIRYFDAPDLKHVGKNGYRFVNAVSDYATHAEPVRRTQNWLPSIFNDFFDNDWMVKANATAPAINVFETEKEYKVELAAPGMTKEDFNVHIDEENNLVISMEKKTENKEEH